MRSYAVAILALVGSVAPSVSAFSMEMSSSAPSRRSFLSQSVATTAAVLVGASMNVQDAAAAAPEIFKTPKGVKYAVLKPPKNSNASPPQETDIVGIEYTGYLTDGTIFDATHATSKSFLVFELGGNAVIPGVNEMVGNMSVGEKVQAIIPPELAFGDKGLCLSNGECLIKPKSTLVYDIYLRQAGIPPP